MSCAIPITKKLHDVVELLGEHDVIYQDMAAQRELGLATLERRARKEKADALRKRLDALKRAIDRGDLDALDE